MTGPVAVPREEETYPLRDIVPESRDEVNYSVPPAWRVEDYGRFRVATASHNLYLIDVEDIDEDDSWQDVEQMDENRYASFDMSNTGKLGVVIEELGEKTLETAIEDNYSMTSAPAASRLQRFKDRKPFSDEDVKNLGRIKQDWLEDAQEAILEEMREDYEFFRNEKNMDFREIKTLFSQRYVRPQNSMNIKMREAGLR
jgi:rRNA maturation protein Nop10